MGAQRRWRLGTLAVTAVVIVGAVVSAVPSIAETWRRAALTAIAAALLGSILAGGLAAFTATTWRRRLLFGAQVGLAIAVLAVGGDGVGLAAMPVVSGAVLELGLGAGALLSGVFVAEIALLSWTGGRSGTAILETSVTNAAATSFVIVFSKLMRDERAAQEDLTRLAAELEQANGRLREYAAQVEDLATANERNRIARDIHDGLGHCLTVVSVQLEAARALLARDPERASECLSRAQEMTRRGLVDVRGSVALLRGQTTDERPLPALIARLADECQAAGLPVEVAVQGEPRPLSPPVQVTLFRAAQEGLTNTRRHARAARATLTVTYEEREVSLRVDDDGVGADAPTGGFGLLGIRERLRLLGGTMEVESAPGDGFSLRVRVPA